MVTTENFKSNHDQVNVRRITERDLKDDKRFLDLYAEFVRRGWFGRSYSQFIEFASYCEKALDEDTAGTPGRLFAALIKAKEGRITQDQEDRGHARSRSLGSDLHEFIQQLRQELRQKQPVKGEPVNPLADRNVGFVPAILAQCFLPQKRITEREWMITHGHATLHIQAGRVADRNDPNMLRPAAIPFGRLARLILFYIVGESVRTRSRQIDMGRSLRQFMERIGLSYKGREGRKVTEAVEDIAAACFTFAFYDDQKHKLHTEYHRLVKKVDFWIEPEENQLTFWTPEITLSEEFFDQIQANRLPLDLDHLASFTRSPRRMDLYVWLSYRIASIRKGRIVSIPLQDLQPLFAPDIESFRLFKQRFKRDLEAVKKIWKFDAEVLDDRLVLGWSEPPIPRQARMQTSKQDT